MKPHLLTDAQWERVRPLLPPQKPATGRPAKDHRTIVEAILWQRSSGRPWRDLPARFGPWQSVYTRLRRWQQAGVWDRVLAILHPEPEAESHLARTPVVVEGTKTAAAASQTTTVPVTAVASRSTSRPGGPSSRWSAA